MNNIQFRHLIGVFSLLFLVACSKRQGIIVDREHTPTSHIEGTWLKSDSLLYTSNIRDIGNGYFASILYRMENLLHIYQIQGDRIIHISSAIKQGNGPFEMSVVELAHDSQNQQLILTDPNTKKTLIADISDPTQIHDLGKWQKSDLFTQHSSFFTDRILVHPDSCFILVGNKHKTQSFLATLNREQSTLQILHGFWPDDDYSGKIIAKQNEYANNATLQKRPSSNRYIYACNDGCYAELFSIQDSLIINRKNLFPIYPAYLSDDGLNPRRLSECLMGMYIYSNDSHLYIRLNKITYGELRENRELDYNSNTEILVYDWDGNLKRIFQMDKPIKSFFVDESEENLYGMILDGEDFRIRRFNIKGDL